MFESENCCTINSHAEDAQMATVEPSDDDGKAAEDGRGPGKGNTASQRNDFERTVSHL